ncbi:divalent metal cation transporter [Patescibacteria group bacterium]|nr:divalent metal cation transporter [Patescibacteria group bacterium]MBU1472375.1 divalent metal cation transporter [Patescibacteria group bacterium]MBU2459888.1 divalent metal cation transporter [Patescibacteria group bacterium]MBU2544727.1 divalent metal cation transporter [Patescibacteria group bacterium]
MMQPRLWLRTRWRRIILIMAVIGPGLITAFADNDAAGVATYSVSAALYGYGMLITLIPVTIVLGLTQEMGARLAIVTQKGLADLIREYYGVKVAVAIFIILFLVNFAVILQNVSGIKSSLELFGLNPVIFLPLIIGLLFIFIISTKYNTIEKFFFILIVFYLTYVASAIMAKPDWNLALKSLIIPPANTFNPRYVFTAVAVLGTTITAWGQFFIHSYIRDKQIPLEHLKYSQWEVYLGAILTDIFSFFIMIAVAATLFVNKIQIADATSAALAIKPFAGEFAGVLFGAGLLVAGLLGCIIVPLTTAYAFSEFFGFSGSLDEDFRKSKLFYSLFIIQILAALFVVLLPHMSLFRITLAANFLNGMILPVIFFFVYQFTNKKTIMNSHTNNTLQNALLIISGIVISVAAIVGSIGGWIWK